jgi:molybdopterin converting factor small subunit
MGVISENHKPQIEVEVVVFATLRKYMPDLKLGESKFIKIPLGTSMAELRDLLKLPQDEVKIVMRNNRHAEIFDVANDGDRIAFIPAVAGG